MGATAAPPCPSRPRARDRFRRRGDRSSGRTGVAAEARRTGSTRRRGTARGGTPGPLGAGR
eukprot:3592550-Prymnesium_polylepis.1